jgi:Protein of unknown function (DUF2555)
MATLTLETLDVDTLTEADVEELANRLEDDDYDDVFGGLNDWHLLRAIAFQRPSLVDPYLHLLDLEPCDES